MSRDVQQKGGPREQQDVFIGQPRQLTIDTSGNEIRVHDGSTPGGHRILNLQQLTSRFQSISNDLTAIDDISDTGLGILTKQGPNSWGLRSIAVDSQNMSVQNPAGRIGNPLISLADEISSQHTFTVQQLFDGGLQASGGVFGDVTGNLTGDSTGTHTGDVTGDVTGNLTGNAAGDHTGSFTGDLDTRGGTVQFDDGQIPLSAIERNNELVFTDDTRLAISPEIKIWFGTAASVPQGWAICNGQQGTPDLRNVFLLGAGDDVLSPDRGDTGGSATHDHEASTSDAGGHTPVITVDGHALSVAEMPTHHHSGQYGTNNEEAAVHGSDPSTANFRADTDRETSAIIGRTDSVGGNLPHDHNASAAAVPDHAHPTTVEESSNVPPYVAVFFIMRL